MLNLQVWGHVVKPPVSNHPNCQAYVVTYTGGPVYESLDHVSPH